MESHQPQHPLSAHPNPVLAVEPGPDFSVSLPGERRVVDHLSDHFRQLIVGDVSDRAGPVAQGVTTEATVLHSRTGSPQHLTHPGRRERPFGGYLGRLGGGM